MLIIMNVLLLACAESSIGSMRVGFLMALAGVPVKELFDCVGYWSGFNSPLLHVGAMAWCRWPSVFQDSVKNMAPRCWVKSPNGFCDFLVTTI